MTIAGARKTTRVGAEPANVMYNCQWCASHARCSLTSRQTVQKPGSPGIGRAAGTFKAAREPGRTPGEKALKARDQSQIFRERKLKVKIGLSVQVGFVCGRANEANFDREWTGPRASTN